MMHYRERNKRTLNLKIAHFLNHLSWLTTLDEYLCPSWHVRTKSSMYFLSKQLSSLFQSSLWRTLYLNFLTHSYFSRFLVVVSSRVNLPWVSNCFKSLTSCLNSMASFSYSYNSSSFIPFCSSKFVTWYDIGRLYKKIIFTEIKNIDCLIDKIKASKTNSQNISGAQWKQGNMKFGHYHEPFCLFQNITRELKT